VLDLSTISKDESSAARIRELIGGRPYLRADGASVLEDYRRLVAISEKFNDIIAFLEKIGQKAAKKSTQYVQLQQSLTKLKDVLNQT
jgi:hypothetical protein